MICQDVTNKLFVVRSLKRDESIESARAGLLRDFEPMSEYNVGSTHSFGNENYGANDRFERGFQGDDYSDFSTDNLRTFTTNSSRVGPPPRGLFDDI